ncbi:MAG: shikimate dehydrogenase [Ruminococcus sp.]|nr:shikimate dehydrogenase [Ruminococcus sp.]
MKRKYALLGETLKHTMSPPIHSRLFELKDRDFEYELVEVSAEELGDKAEYLNNLNGYNITIPHKIGIIDYIDKLDDTAKKYNSVNCVDNKDGILTGYNTDVDGFLRSLSANGGNLGGKVLLLGAGGVGRMMAIETCCAGGELTMAVLPDFIPQTEIVKEDILKICPNAKVKIVTFDSIDGDYDVMINATPVGMYPKCDACVVSDEVISRTKFVFDAIYNPRETVLIKKAKSMGITAVGGMAMLVWQAVSAHEIWDGDSYTDEEVQQIINEMELRVEKDFQ